MKNYSNKSYIRELVKMCCLEISFVKMTVLQEIQRISINENIKNY